MDNYSMFMPSYSIGGEVYNKIDEICSPYGKSAVIIGGKRAMDAIKPYLDKAMEGSAVRITACKWYGGECCYENVDTLVADAAVTSADMIFAVGGGKAVDTGKCVGERTGKPVFSFPTIASNCSCCTSVSIMYTRDNVFLKPHFFMNPPVHAFINTELLANSPSMYLWAGMGDTYAKHYEAEISARGEVPEHYIALGLEMSGMCVKPILRYGAKALEDNKNHIASYEFRQTVLAVCVTTGIVSIMLTHEHTPDYNSGLAHAIFYALTAIAEIEKNHLHGEVVAFGMLIMLLCDKNYDEFEKIFKFNKSTGLPTKTTDIGIEDNDLRALFPQITTMGDIKHFAFRVTVEMLERALKELNKYNNRRI